MTTDQTDHRAEADRLMREAASDPDDYVGAYEHLLAAIHDGQAEQTEWLHRIRDLLAVMAEPKGDPCPCGCRRDVEPKPFVDSDGNPMQVWDDGCGSDCDVHKGTKSAPEPESVTVTLPRDVAVPGEGWDWRAVAFRVRTTKHYSAALLLDALADALDVASATQEANQGEREGQGAGDAERAGDGRVWVERNDARLALDYFASQSMWPAYMRLRDAMYPSEAAKTALDAEVGK